MIYNFSADAIKVITGNPIIATVSALCLAFFEFMYGVGSWVRDGMLLVALLLVADWMSGVSAAKKDGIDTSHYGLVGLTRTALLLILPAIAHILDRLLDTGSLFTYFMIAAMSRNIIKSVIANIHRAGWDRWVPVNVLDMALNWVGAELAHKEQRATERKQHLYGKGGEQDGGTK